jgi:mannose-1-phosphate guanylyltransferase/mannose-1-phosphate guanylyltransferase/mannose-6-phosphate isomerase
MDWTEQRPWGRFKNLLDTEYTKVKLLEVDPGKRLSYQSHSKRRESWTIVRGQARVTLNDQIHELKVGEHIDIPMGARHRLENLGTEILAVVEAQTGSYFGEDDIKRYEDDWNRT